MIDVNVITLEDNQSYIIIDTLIDKDNKYLFLVQEQDEKVTCIRKIIKENNKEFLVKLDNEEEFEEILTLFNDKHRKEGNDEK